MALCNVRLNGGLIDWIPDHLSMPVLDTGSGMTVWWMAELSDAHINKSGGVVVLFSVRLYGGLIDWFLAGVYARRGARMTGRVKLVIGL